MEKQLLKHSIRAATPADVATIFALIRELAVYEKLEHMVSGNESMLHDMLFGAPGKPACCEAVLVEEDSASGRTALGFALFYTTISTFLCKPGLYLEDLYVVPAARGRGLGKALLVHLAALAQSRDCGRFEWRVLDWNTPSIDFYKSLGATVMPEWHLVRMTTPEIAKLAAS